MIKPKYRPSLTAEDINNCIIALQETGYAPSTLKTLRLYAFKIETETMIPLRSTSQSANTEEKRNMTKEELEQEQLNEAQDAMFAEKPMAGYVYKSAKYKHLNPSDNQSNFSADDL